MKKISLSNLPTQVFINNAFHVSPKTFPLLNPTSNQIIGQLSITDPSQLTEAYHSARSVFQTKFSKTSPQQRQHMLQKIAQAVRVHRLELAELETLDSGKPITQSQEDIDYCADAFDYYSTLTYLEGRSVTDFSQHFQNRTQREPLGVVGLITPWNYPFLQAVLKVAPALASGNALLLKPSEHSSLTCLKLAELTKDILPAGVLQVVPGDGSVGAAMQQLELDGMSFTGSTVTGQKILAGCATHLRKCGVELGGKSAAIVDQDADLDKAVQYVFWGCMYNMGQNCVACTRVYLHEAIAAEFKEKLKGFAQAAVQIGDPFDEHTNFGPLNNQMQFDKCKKYVEMAEQDKISFLVHPREFQVPAEGLYQAPVIVQDVEESHPIAQEEIFGPFMTILKPFKTHEEVLAKANASEYGLGAGIFTQSMKTAEKFARELQAGSVWVNNYNMLPLNMPFGGFKKSGFSKEGGPEAVEEYTKIKSVYFDMN